MLLDTVMTDSLFELLLAFSVFKESHVLKLWICRPFWHFNLWYRVRSVNDGVRVWLQQIFCSFPLHYTFISIQSKVFCECRHLHGWVSSWWPQISQVTVLRSYVTVHRVIHLQNVLRSSWTKKPVCFSLLANCTFWGSNEQQTVTLAVCAASLPIFQIWQPRLINKRQWSVHHFLLMGHWEKIVAELQCFFLCSNKVAYPLVL